MRSRGFPALGVSPAARAGCPSIQGSGCGTGILFDLDGVLVDSVAAYRAAWRAWGEKFDVAESAIWAEAHGKRPLDIIRRVAPDVDERTAVAAFAECFATVGTRAIRPMSAARSLLDALPADRWAVVTSGHRVHGLGSLTSAGLPVPPVVVCGDDARRDKPDPEGLLRAAQLLGRVPGACLVVGDTPSGLAAAREAGMTSIAIATTYNRCDLALASRVYDSLAQASADLIAAVHSTTSA